MCPVPAQQAAENAKKEQDKESAADIEGNYFDPNYRKRRHHQGPTESRIHQAHTTAPEEIAFKGRCDELDGFTYTVTTSKGGLELSKTSEEIARYAGEKYTSIGMYVKNGIVNLQIPTPSPPERTEGTNDTATNDRIFNAKIEEDVTS